MPRLRRQSAPAEGALRLRPRLRLEEAARAAPPASEAGSDSDGVFDEAAATRDAKKLKVAELRAALEAAGADTEGLKAELVERLVAARRAAFYAPPPPPSDSDSDSDTGVDIAAEEATKEKLLALLAESDDDDVPAAAPKTKKQKKQARPPAGGVPKPRGRAPAGPGYAAARGRTSGGHRRHAGERPRRHGPDRRFK